MATDFDKYPKYLLTKHGKDIQNILNNAETFFGMQADSAANVAIKQELSGGELLRNANGEAAVFRDAFTIMSEAGKVAIALEDATDYDPETEVPAPVEVALANYATDSDIQKLFEADPDSGDEPSITQKSTPVISFAENNQIQISSPGNDGNRYLIQQVTYNADSTNKQELYTYTYESVFTISDIIASDIACICEYSVFSVGNNITTLTSEKSNTLTIVYLAPVIPEYTADLDAGGKKYKLSYPAESLPTGVTPQYNYTLLTFDYIDAVRNILTGNVASTANAYCDVTAGATLVTKTTGSVTDQYIDSIRVVDSSELVITGPTKTLSSVPNINTETINSNTTQVCLNPSLYRNEVPLSYVDTATNTTNYLLLSYEVEITEGLNGDVKVQQVLPAYQAQAEGYIDKEIKFYVDTGDYIKVRAVVSNFFSPSGFASKLIENND